MRKAKHSILFLLLLLLVVSCHKTQPQRPSNKPIEQADSATLALLYARQRMASEADKIIIAAVQADSTHHYAQDALGYWYRYIRKVATSEPILTKGEMVDIHMIIKDIQGETILLDEAKQIELGKSDLPTAVKYMLREMRHGEHTEMLVPWYAGFGTNGHENIEPYQNLRIELSIE